MNKEDKFEYFNEFSFRNVQLVFCVDTTGSMSSYIKATKDTIKNILDGFKHLKFYRYKFGFVAYRDHCDAKKSYLTKVKDFCTGDKMVTFIDNEIKAGGGGDNPEAVLDGLNDCVEKLTWDDNSVKIVFHVADAPPHGKKYYDGHDEYPKGCPNGLTIQKIADKFKLKNIKYILLDCSDDKNDNLYKMKCEFGARKNFGKFKTFELSDGTAMLVKVGEYLENQYYQDKEEIEKKIRKDLLDV